MTLFLTILGLGLVLVLGIAAGGVLVGVARSGELQYMRERTETLEKELAIRPSVADMERLSGRTETLEKELAIRPSVADMERLSGRNVVLETELLARPREADIGHLRESYERTLVARDLDLTHLRAAHGTAIAQVIALADKAAHDRLNPRTPSRETIEDDGPPRSFDPAAHREAEMDTDRLLETPRYPLESEEDIRAQFDRVQEG